MTSRWMLEVAPQRDLSITWRVMSLAILNENTDIPSEYREFYPKALRYTRLVTAVAERVGAEHVGELYSALGERIHPAGMSDADVVMREALDALGLDADLIRFADSDEHDVQLRASHDAGIRSVGQDVGTPIISVNGVAFFGPVISPAPRGAEAAALWDGVVAVANYDGFFELKRSRTRDPLF